MWKLRLLEQNIEGQEKLISPPDDSLNSIIALIRKEPEMNEGNTSLSLSQLHLSRKIVRVRDNEQHPVCQYLPEKLK